MNNEQQPAAELIDKPPAEVDGEKLIVPEEWSKHFDAISKTLTEMDSWKTMTIEKDGITKVTAKRVIAKKLRIEIEDVRKILGRTIMARKANVDAFAESLKDAVTAVEIALEVIENAHKTKVKAEREGREAEAAKILNDRVQLLEKYGYIPPDVAAVGKMTSPDFLELLAGRRRIFERAENLRDRMRRIREVGPDDTSESIIEVMSNDSFETFLKCHRVACEVAERERAEAEQSERDRVEKLERELEESQRRIAELEESQTVKPIVNSSGDTMLPQIGEVIDAEFQVIQPGVVALPPGHDVQTVADTVEIAVNLRTDVPELYRIGNELDLSADVFRMFMGHLSKIEISAVFRIEKKTGVGTLIRVNGLDVDRPF